VLGQELSCEVPVFAVFAAAPDVSYGIDAAAFEPGDVLGVEEGIERNAVRAVAFQSAGFEPSSFTPLRYTIDSGISVLS
jgi:hypothetical protein